MPDFKATTILHKLLSSVPRASANLLLPHQCVICRCFTDSTSLCATCWHGLQIIGDPICAHCGRPLAHAMPQMKCGACWVAPPPLAKIRAACLYGAASRSLILKFKHGDGLQLVPVFGQILRRAFTSICEPDHLVIPVPLHRWRYLRRRFNQSAELARYLTTTYDIGVFSPALLERVKPTISQGGLNRDQRRRNLRGAFHVSAHHQPVIAGKPVILVDDVITTGATLYEAANCLMRAGSGPVYAIAIARVG